MWWAPLKSDTASVTQIPVTVQKPVQMCYLCYGFGIICVLDAVLHKNSYYASGL